MTSSPILSVTNTSLVNQTYSLTLQGLNPSTTYSVRVVAVYDIISARYSDLLPFRTYDQGISTSHTVMCASKFSFSFAEQVIYLPFLNHTTTYISSGQLQPCDDCSSVEIVFPEDLPFGGYFHQSAYVCNLSVCMITIRESVDSLCRDGADLPRPPYIGKACARLNGESLSLFRGLTMVLK